MPRSPWLAFGRVHEERGRAGGCQRGGDLAPHMAALAHAHDDHAPGRGQQQLHRLHKHLAQARAQALQYLGLDIEGLAPQAQGLRGIEGRGRMGRWAWANLSVGPPRLG